jgi:prolyl oligopeptidase
VILDIYRPLAISLLAAVTLGAHAQAHTSLPAAPPAAPVREVTDDYFGKKVVDPYRWMEDMRNPELLGWMKAQADYTRAALDGAPGRQAALDRLTALNESARARVRSVRRSQGDRYFYLKAQAGENVSKLYVREGLAGKETLLLDPEKVSAGPEEHLTISYYEPSWDGRLAAVGLAPNGSERSVVRIVDTSSGRETGEVVDRAWFGGVSWLPDGRSFLYNRVQQLPDGAPPTELEQKSRVYLHAVGTSPEKDRAVFGHGVSPKVDVGPTLLPFAIASPASPFAIAAATTGVGGGAAVYAAPLASLGDAEVPWRKVCDAADEVTDYAARGDDLYLVTSKGAPRYKVVRVDLRDPDLAAARTVVPASEAVVGGGWAGLNVLTVAEDALYVQQLDGGVGRLLRVPFAGGARAERVDLGFEGTIQAASADPRLPGVVVQMTSWVSAPAVYAYDPKTGRTSDTGLQPLGPLDRPADLEAVEVKVESADGTPIPLSIVHKRGLKLDGNNPTLVHGYGAYGISQLPSFDPKLLAWYERGGVYAVAHVRGGGEYGAEWHLAGQKRTKPNTWRDFIACAEYLVRNKYTSPARLAGMGASAGGILIGRAITERPDLFGAAIVMVGLNDMLRFETTANGVPNVPEFGSVGTREGFETLYEMSPYHHVRGKTAYPAVLLMTGINDPRVEPWFSAKLAARLQAATSSGRPVLLRVDYRSGHGVGSTKRQIVDEMADMMSFLLWQFGDPAFQAR